MDFEVDKKLKDGEGQHKFFAEVIKAIPFFADLEGDLINLHSSRVAILASKLGTQMLESNKKTLFLAGLYHDIGANGSSIHPARARSLSDHSRNPWLKNHTIRAHHSLKRISKFGSIAQAVLEHHEWYDGGGYPLGKAGTNIMMEAQAIRVVDAFDCSMLFLGSPEAAFENLRMRAGREYDEDLLELFKRVFEESDAAIYWGSPERTIADVMEFYSSWNPSISADELFSFLILFDLKRKPIRGHTKRVAELVDTICRTIGSTAQESMTKSVIVHEMYTTYEPYKGSFIGSASRRDILDCFPEVQEAFNEIEEDPWVSEIVRACCMFDHNFTSIGEPYSKQAVERTLSEMTADVSPDTLLLLEKAAGELSEKLSVGIRTNKR